MLSLLEEWGGWVHRRVEHVTLSDPEISERRISLDFTLAPNPRLPPIKEPGAVPTYLVPLTLLEKRRITQFSLRDESDRALSVLIRAQTAAIATAVLIESAADAFEATPQVDRDGERRATDGRAIPKDVVEDLWIIAAAKRGEAIEKWLELGTPPGHLSRGKRRRSEAWRKAMLGDDEFLALAYDLARNFLLLTRVTGYPGARRIVKLSFEEQRQDTPVFGGGPSLIKGPRRYLEQAQRFFGLRAKAINLPATGVGRAQCYHMEVEVPEGIRLTRAKLRAFKPEEQTLIATSGKQAQFDSRLGGNGRFVDVITRNSQRLHLHLNDVPRAFTGTGTMHLRIGNGLVLRGALINAIFTTMLLAGVAVWPTPFRQNPDVAVTVLLGIPGGISLYLARPREPGMATSMHAGVRLLAIANAGAAFGAIGVVLVAESCALQKKTGARVCTPTAGSQPGLIVCASVAGVLLAILCLSYLFSVRPPEGG